MHYFAIFDGHYGLAAAEFGREHFHQIFFQKYTELATKVPVTKLLEDTFEAAEQQFLEEASKKQTEAGTCVGVALLCGAKLIVGNVGDCGIVLSRSGKPVVLTEWHNGQNA